MTFVFSVCRLVSRRCHMISAIHQLCLKPSQVGSRTGAPTVGFGGSSTPFGVGLSPTPMITVPVPATSNPACRFPALGFPGDFTSRVMRPIGWERFWASHRQCDSPRTIATAHTATPDSTSSNQSPGERVRPSNDAEPSSRPSPSRSQNTDWHAPHEISSPTLAASGSPARRPGRPAGSESVGTPP